MTTAEVTQDTMAGFDGAKAEAFAGKMLGNLNGAMLTLLTSVGSQTGLFETMAGMNAASSDQIAAATGLTERYVREWLGGMVLGGIVEYDPAAKTYRLPPEHAPFLTKAGGPDNMASFATYVPLFAQVEPQIVDAFKNGGGAPYSAFPRFQELQAIESAAIYDATLIERTLPSIPGLVRRLEAGIDAADIGCGSGHAINLMAKAFPNSRFTGHDISDGGIAAGRAEAAAMGNANAVFQVTDAAAMDLGGAYDFIMVFDAIHDQVDPKAVLRNIRRALRPGGIFLMVDIAASSNLEENFDNPLGPAMFGVSTFHCMTVSLAHGGEGLGTMWGDQKARQYLADAGFSSVATAQVEGDAFNSYYVARP